MFARARVAGESDLPVGADQYIGVDALDAIFNAVAQVGEDDRAIDDLHMADGEIIAAASPDDGRRFGALSTRASRSRRSGT